MKIFSLLYLVTIGFGVHGVAPAQSSARVTAIDVDEDVLTLPCPAGHRSCGTGPSKDFIVDVRVKISGKTRESTLKYDITYGRVIGTGQKVRWDLRDQRPGNYRITVTHFVNGKAIGEPKTAAVVIESDICICDCFCPQLKIYGPSKIVKRGSIQSFSASVQGGPDVTYKWSVENGQIVSGQGTSEIKVRVKRKSKLSELKATVQLGGLDPACGCPSQATIVSPIVE